MRSYIKKTIKFYDKYVEDYVKKTNDLQNTAWLKKFAASLPKKARVLDLGCAFGRDCKFFVENGFQTYGVDLSENMIKRAREFVKGARFLVMDILDLQFEDCFFDGVWCSATLIHLSKSDVPPTIKEICRILKDNGLLYLNLKEGRGERIVKDKRYGGAEKFYSYFTENEIKRILSKHNFEILDFEVVRRQSHEYRHKGSIYLIARKTKGA